MTFDPDRTEKEGLFSLEEKLDELLAQLKWIAKLLEVIADEEVSPDDVEE